MANQFLHITSSVNIQVKLILNRLYKAQATNIICLVFFSFVSWCSEDYGEISISMQRLDQKHFCAKYPWLLNIPAIWLIGRHTLSGETL